MNNQYLSFFVGLKRGLLTSMLGFLCVAALVNAEMSAALTAPPATAPTTQLHGGSVVPHGQYGAIGIVHREGAVGLCTGTLVADRTVLTAAHCLCDDGAKNCATRGRFEFKNVMPSGTSGLPNERQDIFMSGRVVIHPKFKDRLFGTLPNHWDFALIILDEPYYKELSHTDVRPIYVATKQAKVGDYLTSFGYGLTGSAGLGGKCNIENPDFGTLKKGRREVEERGDQTYVFSRKHIHYCPGDSGGPAIDDDGRVTSVSNNISIDIIDWPPRREDIAARITPEVFKWMSYHGCTPPDSDHPNVWGQCSNPLCPCPIGGADCDSDSQCKLGLSCNDNVGATYGYPGGADVCECPEFDASKPNPNFCAHYACGKCPHGVGDCDRDSDCAFGATCEHDVGARFGLPSYYDVCVTQSTIPPPSACPGNQICCEQGNDGRGCDLCIAPGQMCP